MCVRQILLNLFIYHSDISSYIVNCIADKIVLKCTFFFALLSCDVDISTQWKIDKNKLLSYERGRCSVFYHAKLKPGKPPNNFCQVDSCASFRLFKETSASCVKHVP